MCKTNPFPPPLHTSVTAAKLERLETTVLNCAWQTSDNYYFFFQYRFVTAAVVFLHFNQLQFQDTFQRVSNLQHVVLAKII